MNDTSQKNSLMQAINLKTALCAFCLIALYWPVLRDLVYDWIHIPDYSHGFLIPAISLYIAYEKLNKNDVIPFQRHSIGLIVLVAGITMLILGRLAHEFFLMRFSLIFVLVGVIDYLLGRGYTKTLFFPITYLFFMIPLPSILLQKVTFPLQLFVTELSAQSLKAIGIPLLKEGNIIYLSSTVLEVADACSGIRSLIALLAIGVIVAFYVHKNSVARSVLVFFCIPIAILANAIRVIMSGVLANLYGSQVVEGFLHSFAGMVTFLIAMVFLVVVSFMLKLVEKRFSVGKGS